MGHLGDILPSQSFGLELKKLNPTQQKQTTWEQNGISYCSDFIISYMELHCFDTVGWAL